MRQGAASTSRSLATARPAGATRPHSSNSSSKSRSILAGSNGRLAKALSTTVARKSVYDDFRNILDDAERPAIIVDSISETTFKLSDGIILPSNAVFLNGTAFMWDVPPPAFDWPGWTQEMFEVFEVVAPKPDILLFGTGRSALPPPPWLRPYLNSLGIQLDIMDSRNACSTFNLLAEEGRRVAAACLTLAPLDSRTGAPILPSKAS